MKKKKKKHSNNTTKPTLKYHLKGQYIVVKVKYKENVTEENYANGW